MAVEEIENSKFSGTVLVAEDDRTNQILIRRLLEKMGYTITIAEDGIIAVQKGLADSFDIIIMDMQMPNMNGYEAAMKLRGAGIATPIVALTANAMKGDKEKCLDAGCSDYLAKPIGKDDLRPVQYRKIETQCLLF